MVSLDRGDPDFSTPASIVDAMNRALRDGYTHYGDLNGDPELRAYIAERASAYTGDRYDDSQVLITPGSTAGLATAIYAIAGPGDRIVLFDPTYPAYAEQAALAGATVVRVPFREDGGLHLEALREAVVGARLLVLCHPSNPTGAVFSEADLRGLTAVLEGSDTIVLADEAHADIVYDNRPYISTMGIPELRPRLVNCRSFSKTYAMAGWRLGYLIAPPELAKVIRRIHLIYNCGVNSAVQRAGLFALRTGTSLVMPMLQEYQHRRDLVVDWMRQTGLLRGRVPEGTFYAYPRYPHPIGSVEMVRHLLRYGVCVRAGAFDGPGGEHHLRISFSTNTTDLIEGLSRLEKGLRAL